MASFMLRGFTSVKIKKKMMLDTLQYLGRNAKFMSHIKTFDSYLEVTH